MNMQQFNVDTETIINHLIVSVIYIVGVFLFRATLIRLITSWRVKQQDERRKWIVQIRYLSITAIFLGLVVIWATEIRMLAFSIVAFAVALVIAFKEMLSNVVGSLVKSSNRLFEVGDRIEIDGIRGDVIDHTFFITTVFEVLPSRNLQKYTGRIVKIPNSTFLVKHLYNETSSARYFLHTMIIPLSTDADWHKAEKILLTAAVEETKSFIDSAKKYLQKLEKREGIQSPDLTPIVFLDIPEKDIITLHLRTPLRYDLKGIIEQNILRKFATEFYPAHNPREE